MRVTNTCIQPILVLKVEWRDCYKSFVHTVISPSNCNATDARFQRALGVAAMAENAAKYAEIVRGAAVAEREAAVHEAMVIRETMEVTPIKNASAKSLDKRGLLSRLWWMISALRLESLATKRER